MTIEERHHRAVAGRADAPEAHKRGLRAKGPHRRLRAWGAPGPDPRLSRRGRSPQVFPGRRAAASRWRTTSALSPCGTATGE